MPKLQGTATVSGNTNGGVCANPQAILGVDVDVKVGLECYVYAGDNYQSPDWRKTLFEKMWTLYDQCFVLAKKPPQPIKPAKTVLLDLPRPTLVFPGPVKLPA